MERRMLNVCTGCGFVGETCQCLWKYEQIGRQIPSNVGRASSHCPFSVLSFYVDLVQFTSSRIQCNTLSQGNKLSPQQKKLVKSFWVNFSIFRSKTKQYIIFREGNSISQRKKMDLFPVFVENPEIISTSACSCTQTMQSSHSIRGVYVYFKTILSRMRYLHTSRTETLSSMGNRVKWTSLRQMSRDTSFFRLRKFCTVLFFPNLDDFANKWFGFTVWDGLFGKHRRERTLFRM